MEVFQGHAILVVGGLYLLRIPIVRVMSETDRLRTWSIGMYESKLDVVSYRVYDSVIPFVH
jgi:hypothetical protein